VAVFPGRLGFDLSDRRALHLLTTPQVSGQGPYYGQSIWFERYHQEKLPSALERYTKEVARVTGVLETHLSQQPAGQDGPWLVGGKMSYADGKLHFFYPCGVSR